MSTHTAVLVRTYIDMLAVNDQERAGRIRERLDKQSLLQRQIVDHLAKGGRNTARIIAHEYGRTSSAVLEALRRMEQNGCARRATTTRPHEWILA